MYCTDQEITSLGKLHAKYYQPFEAKTGARKMKLKTFYKYMPVYHPEFHNSRLVEDACDCCVALNRKLVDLKVSKEDKVSIREALANHSELARSLRKTMRTVILLWKRSVE